MKKSICQNESHSGKMRPPLKTICFFHSWVITTGGRGPPDGWKRTSGTPRGFTWHLLQLATLRLTKRLLRQLTPLAIARWFVAMLKIPTYLRAVFVLGHAGWIDETLTDFWLRSRCSHWKVFCGLFELATEFIYKRWFSRGLYSFSPSSPGLKSQHSQKCFRGRRLSMLLRLIKGAA